MCARCDRQLSEITDHKVPAREAIEQARASGKYPFDRYAGYFLRSNLQGVCRPCHYVKTNEDKTHTGPWPSVMDAEAAAPKKTYSF
jgi:5-methylcytosine-specific restriction endonuclease McrA